MKLGINERLFLQSLFPQQGDLVTMQLVREAVGVLALRDEELTEMEVVSKADGNGGIAYTWNPEKAVARDVPLGLRARALLLERFRQLDKEKKLELRMLDLYERLEAEEKPAAEAVAEFREKASAEA